MRVVEQILDLARWAPSGDNTQPWRFEILADDHVVVHGFDTREWCVYDVNGRPSQLALGALLENISIAAHSHGLSANVTRRPNQPESNPRFDVHLVQAPANEPDPLVGCIATRTVQRRPLSTRPLTVGEKSKLQQATGDGYEIRWLEGWTKRWTMARLLFQNAKLRLTMPEAYAVHRDVIAWNSRFSEDKVPDAAIGLDPFTTRIMAWTMRSWARVEFLNRFLAGTVAPRIQLDLLPALLCAAHFVIIADKQPQSIDDHVDAGRAMQRFWLTVTQLGLQLQPELTPLIFAVYVREGSVFSRIKGTYERAQRLAFRLDALMGSSASPRAVFMGRIGAGPTATARSLRLPLQRLIVSSS